MNKDIILIKHINARIVGHKKFNNREEAEAFMQKVKQKPIEVDNSYFGTDFFILDLNKLKEIEDE